MGGYLDRMYGCNKCGLSTSSKEFADKHAEDTGHVIDDPMGGHRYLLDEDVDRAIASLTDAGYHIRTYARIADFFPEEKVDSDDTDYGARMMRFHEADEEMLDKARDAVRKAIRIALGVVE